MAGVIVDLLLQQDLQEWHSLFLCPLQTVRKSNCFCWWTIFCIGFCLPSESCKYLLFRKLGSLRTTDKGKRHWDPPESLSRRQTREGEGREFLPLTTGTTHAKNTWSHKCRYHLRNLIQAFSKILKLAKGRGFLTVCHCKVLHWVCTYTYIWLFEWHPISGPCYHIKKWVR
jgi:hypothetical protein